MANFTRVERSKDPSPYRGLMWVLVCAVIMAAAYFAFGKRWQSSAPPEKIEPTPQEQAEAQPLLPPAYEAKREPRPTEVPTYLTDPSMLRDMKSETLVDYPFYYLLYQLKIADIDVLRKDAVPAPSPEEFGRLEPGTAVLLEATVVSLNVREDICIPDVGLSSATEYELKDAQDNLYLVFAVHDVTGIAQGDRVKLVGRFLRMYPHVPASRSRPGETGEEGEGEEPADEKAPVPPAEPKPTPVIIARGLEAPSYLTDASVLEKVRDDTFGEEPKAFYYLVHNIGLLSQEQLKEKADSSLTPKSISRFPEAARGQAVGIEGVLVMSQQRNERPNIAGIDRLYRCILRTREGPWFWVYTLASPAGFTRGDTVKAYGLFFKSYRYVSVQKRECIAQLMMARGLVRMEYEESHHLALLTVAVGAILLAVLTVAVVLDRQKSRRINRHVRELSAKSRPKDLNGVARAVAARTRQAEQKQTPPENSPPPDTVG